MLVKAELKEQILNLLQGHRGQQNAIKGMALAGLCGLRDDRAIRMTIEELISDGFPIASSCSENKTTGVRMGYFLPITILEEYNYKHQLRSRAIGNFHRYKSFKIACERSHLQAEQVKML